MLLKLFWGPLGGSWEALGGFLEHFRYHVGALEGFQAIIGVILEAAGRILGHLGGILDVSSGKCLKKVEGPFFFGRVLGSKMEAQIVKIRV